MRVNTVAHSRSVSDLLCGHKLVNRLCHCRGPTPACQHSARRFRQRVRLAARVSIETPLLWAVFSRGIGWEEDSRFHIPGHKGRLQSSHFMWMFLAEGAQLMHYDLTEVKGRKRFAEASAAVDINTFAACHIHHGKAWSAAFLVPTELLLYGLCWENMQRNTTAQQETELH